MASRQPLATAARASLAVAAISLRQPLAAVIGDFLPSLLSRARHLLIDKRISARRAKKDGYNSMNHGYDSEQDEWKKSMVK